MKAFAIPLTQIAEIVGALVTDELSWRFRRYKDTLTISSLSVETALGPSGLDLDSEERNACAKRAAKFFGANPSILVEVKAETIGDWSRRLEKEINRKLQTFRFTAAGRDSEIQSTTHTADVIFEDAAASSGLIFGRRRLISLVAPHSLMGFVLTILTPNLQQLERIDARGVAPEELTDMLAFGDVVVATPSLWRFLMQEGTAAPDNVMAIYFGEKMPPDLAVTMRKSGFGAQREIYGSTETGLIGWRDSPGEAFRLFDSILRDGDKGFLRKLPSGEIASHDAMDLLTWRTDRSFVLSGRRDGAVQIGAVNVFPEVIAERLCRHEKIADCIVRVGRHDGGFDRLIAHIALKDGYAPSESIARNIDTYCRDVLYPHERPRVYKFEASIEGKKKPAIEA